jgi:uncharacterized protein (TIGR03118 family)
MFCMKNINTISAYLSRSTLFVLLASSLLFSSCIKDFDQKPLSDFKQVNLVGNNNEYNPQQVDPALINAWGIAFSTGGTPWVNSTFGGVSAIYNANTGATVRPAVNVPSPLGPTGGLPTGIVFNTGGPDDFILSNGQRGAFLFVGLDGILSGWNSAAGNNAVLIKDNSKTSVYTGLAIGAFNNNDYIYASNFRTGKIDVWNSQFDPVNMAFRDPGLPQGYAPFNIQNIEDKLYVAYALVGPNGRDVPGVGNGIVSVFNMDGTFVKRFASGGKLNAPWGLAKAPASFFADNNDNGIEDILGNGFHKKRQPAILVGNFGDGRINAYNLEGTFLGQLKNDEGVIVIEGLWAITFPPVSSSIDKNRLYFAAGPDEEEDGLFGYLVKD